MYKYIHTKKWLLIHLKETGGFLGLTNGNNYLIIKYFTEYRILFYTNFTDSRSIRSKNSAYRRIIWTPCSLHTPLYWKWMTSGVLFVRDGKKAALLITPFSLTSCRRRWRPVRRASPRWSFNSSNNKWFSWKGWKTPQHALYSANSSTCCWPSWRYS